MSSSGREAFAGGASVLLQERLIAMTSEEVRGQALGPHVTAALGPGLRLSEGKPPPPDVGSYAPTL